MDINKQDIKSINLSYSFENQIVNIELEKTNGTKLVIQVTSPNEQIKNLFINTLRVTLSQSSNNIEQDIYSVTSELDMGYQLNEVRNMSVVK